MKYWVNFEKFRETGFIGWTPEYITQGRLNDQTLIQVTGKKAVIQTGVKNDNFIAIELSVEEGRRLLKYCTGLVSWIRIPCTFKGATWVVEIHAGYATAESVGTEKPHWVGDEYKKPVNFPSKTFKVSGSSYPG